MYSTRTSRLWSPARPADEAWYRRRIPQSPQITQPTQISPLVVALSKSASSAQLPPPGTALTIPPILSPAGGVMKKTTGLLWGPKNGVSSVSYQNPQNWADYNSRPSVPVQFFLKLRPLWSLRPKPPQISTIPPTHEAQTALALPSPICYIQLNRYPLSPPAESAKLKFGGVYETLEDIRIYGRCVGILAYGSASSIAGFRLASPRRATGRCAARHPLPGFPANHHLHQTR
jgi:hypothetical protein